MSLTVVEVKRPNQKLHKFGSVVVPGNKGLKRFSTVTYFNGRHTQFGSVAYDRIREYKDGIRTSEVWYVTTRGAPSESQLR